MARVGVAHDLLILFFRPILYLFFLEIFFLSLMFIRYYLFSSEFSKSIKPSVQNCFSLT